MIDTHAHLDLCADRPETLLDRAREAGVTRVVTIGSGAAGGRRALEITERSPGVACALGIHPHDAGKATAAEFAELRKLLAHPCAVAVGETGLDHYRDYSPRKTQAEVFAKQIELAGDVDMPLIIHSRAADDDTLAALAAAPPGLPVVFHCLSSLRLAEAAVEHGYYCSFAGNVTYPKAADLREAAALVPAERILAETDAPYLAPQPVRGQKNEPAFVMHVLAELVEVRGVSPPELERQIETNATRLFGLE